MHVLYIIKSRGIFCSLPGLVPSCPFIKFLNILFYLPHIFIYSYDNHFISVPIIKKFPAYCEFIFVKASKQPF